MALGLKQLHYCVVAAEEEQLTRAARKLHVAQPALSRAILQVESELGVELFERHARGITPTPAGVTFLEKARVALGADDAAFAKARTTVDGDAVLLSVTDGNAMRTVRVTPTSPTSPARNNWSPPRDQWVDLPIIDKSYSTQKLNLFRWSEKLEGSITAHRGDDSPRAPPVPKWLERFVEVFKRAVEDCLR